MIYSNTILKILQSGYQSKQLQSYLLDVGISPSTMLLPGDELSYKELCIAIAEAKDNPLIRGILVQTRDRLYPAFKDLHMLYNPVSHEGYFKQLKPVDDVEGPVKKDSSQEVDLADLF